MKIKKLIKLLFVLAIILSNVSCDQITKEKVRKEIAHHESIQVIGDNFMLTRVENTGAALSLGENLSPNMKIIFLQVLPLLILLFLFVYILRAKEISKINLIGFSFIIGGGIGNIYDRIVFNAVTDFMYIDLGFLQTGIFNMADVSVVIGTLLILINSIFSEFYKNQYKTIDL